MDKAILARFAADDPVFQFVAAGFLYRSGKGSVHGGPVIRMNMIDEGFVSRAELLRLQTENTLDFIRPREPVLDNIQCPAAQMGDLLCPLQERLAFPECFLGLLAHQQHTDV